MTHTPATPRVRWGILGTGAIAHRFMSGLRAVPEAEVVAVGSRSRETARRFARTWGIDRAHGDYADLAADSGVDIVYVATPHNVHHDATVLCLDAGRHVLCEKPLALNAAEAAQMMSAAKRSGAFLMEAMWTRFAPATAKARDLVAAGAIGQVRMVSATIGARTDYDPRHRLFDPGLAGGALLDVGVYPLAFASMFLGEFTDIQAQASAAPSGVDSQVAMAVTGRTGALGLLGCSIETPIPRRAEIVGTRGTLAMADWYCPTGLLLQTEDAQAQEFDFPHIANGFEYEVMEVHRRLGEGAAQSPLMPWAESLRIAQALDTVRARIGLTYPGEGP